MKNYLMGHEIKVKTILVNDWDPIGINGNPNAESEYDTYALQIVRLLYEKAGEAKIYAYLEKLTHEFGLVPDKKILETVSKKIAQISVSD